MGGLGGLFHTNMPLDEGQASEEGLCGVDCSFEALESVREWLDMEGDYVPASCHWSN
jgi:hypothetical protein